MGLSFFFQTGVMTGVIAMAGYGFLTLFRVLDQALGIEALLFSDARQFKTLEKVCDQLQLLQEQLESGLFPDLSQWEQIKTWPDPWGEVMRVHVLEMRSRGLSVVPTIRRIKKLATETASAQWEAKSKSAQALGQALVCGSIIPVCSLTLYYLIPGLKAHFWTWILMTVICFLWSGLGALWIIKLADQARWSGLSQELRGSLLDAQVTVEGFTAQVKSGLPADIAWARAVQGFSARYTPLASGWSANIFSTQIRDKKIFPSKEGLAQRRILELGFAIQKAIQLSLMEGRPCNERIELLSDAFRTEWKGNVDRALAQLPNQALKPLFLCIAPAAFLLLGGALYYSVQGF